MKINQLRWNRIAILAIIPVLLCLAIFVFGSVITHNIKQSFWKNDPIQAAQIAHAMTDYTLPAGYQERAYFQFQDLNQVIIRPGDAVGGMDILLFNETLDMSEQELIDALEDNWVKEVGEHTYQTERAYTETVMLCGQETLLSYRTGTNEDNQAVKQLVTIFYGKNGWVVVVIASPVEYWNQDLVNEFLYSLK